MAPLLQLPRGLIPMSSLMYVIRPPPGNSAFTLSALKAAYPFMAGVLHFAVSFDSWISATSILYFSMNNLSSSVLVFMPSAFHWRILSGLLSFDFCSCRSLIGSVKRVPSGGRLAHFGHSQLPAFMAASLLSLVFSSEHFLLRWQAFLHVLHVSRRVLALILVPQFLRHLVVGRCCSVILAGGGGDGFWGLELRAQLGHFHVARAASR